MIPRFSFARPTTLAGAFDAHAASGGDSAYLAGGTELLQVMKMGLAQFGTLIDLKRIEDLRGISTDEQGLWIGATVTHREIERSPIVQRMLPALAVLESHVANVRVRNTGTLGGNLCFAEPHSDPATLLLACDAAVELASERGRRLLRVDQFVVGPLLTERQADEVLLGVRVPARVSGEGRGYQRIAFFERPAASVAVRLRVSDGHVVEATVAVGSLTEVPMLVPAAGHGLKNMPAAGAPTAAVPRAALDALGSVDAVDDLNGSADYKRQLAGLMLRSALRAALAEASLPEANADA